MKKIKLLFRLFALVACITCALSAGAYDFEYNGIYYNITGTNTVSVTKASTYGSDYSGNVFIPYSFTYDGIYYSVTAIGENAFLSCHDLLSVSIPSSVRTIENSAFYYCTSLKSVKIPASVTTIGDWNFYNSEELTTVELPFTLTSMGSYCFDFCEKLTSVTCRAKTPPALDTGCFSHVADDCVLYVLQSRINDYQSDSDWSDHFSSIEPIQDYSFSVDGIYYNITGNNTVSVTYRDSEYNSYSGDIVIPEQVTYNGITYTVTAIANSAFQMSSNLTSIQFPSTVTKIGSLAFDECTSLTYVDIPNTVTEVGGMAFYGCTSLETVTIGANCDFTYVYNVFRECPNLFQITCMATTPPVLNDPFFDESTFENAVLYVPAASISAYQSAPIWRNFNRIDETLFDFEQDGIYYKIVDGYVAVAPKDPHYRNYSGDVSIPSVVSHDGVDYEVERIHYYAFGLCEDLLSVSLPNTLFQIDYAAFFGCKKLTDVTIPDGVTLVADAAFEDCTSLSYVKLPEGLTHLGKAFTNCNNLRKITIPPRVSRIYMAFNDCPSMREVECLSLTPPEMFEITEFDSDTYELGVLRVPYEAHEAYRQDAKWGQFNNIVSADVAEIVNYGDVNNDGQVSIADVTTLIDLLLGGMNEFIPAADVNGDGFVSIADVTTLIDQLLGGDSGAAGNHPIAQHRFLINGAPFEMVAVDGGTFMMGAQSGYSGHEVTLSSYAIGQTEVTQKLWTAVMGSNPSHFTGNVNRPVETVSWYDCKNFVTELSRLTGLNFRLPSDAEWEFAARGGNKTHGYKYSGSDNINDVGWYRSNSGNTTHPVASLLPNELGLYDMSGNLFEWCQDFYGDLSDEPQVNPTGPATGPGKITRDGSWERDAYWSAVARRTYWDPNEKGDDTGLRLAMDLDQTFTVNGVSFKMVAVQGGTLMLGATEEQGSGVSEKEKPAHQVTLSSYMIGQTEVTQELWFAVMGTKPSYNDWNPLRPVEHISWNQMQTFISKLNQMTGQHFRLPTEAEWEFAARGGNKSNGTMYAGGSNITEVAWYSYNSQSFSHPVATKAPNELGLYDMSGNVYESCQDWLGDYTSDAQVDPTGPETGTYRVIHGGYYSGAANTCRVSYRGGNYPTSSPSIGGFRIAL